MDNFKVECNCCGQIYENWVGSTPCCGSIAFVMDKPEKEFMLYKLEKKPTYNSKNFKK